MNGRTCRIGEVMAQSNVGFGTSGARGLVDDMTDEVCYAYTLGFIQHLQRTGELSGSGPIGVGGDLRPSTDRIMIAVAGAIEHKGYTPVSLGKLPSPALAFYGLEKRVPTIMVTGSHIPDDRNGIKYNKASGEILKHDEAAMKAQEVEIPDGLFDGSGMFDDQPTAPPAGDEGTEMYVRRYLDFFDPDSMAGRKLGVYQHSAVGRELLVRILEGLGADVTALGFEDKFIPVDTEAIRAEDIESAKTWTAEHGFDSILSTDGDSDRPLISDETGKWLRGDVAGILCAAWLGADAVITPVSCNSAVEKSGLFEKVVRTRIGSPYVIEAMKQARADGFRTVVGYEANGGFLIETPIERGGKILAPLPTRDAVILHLAILAMGIEKNKPISRLLAELPQRFTHSDRLKEFPTDRSKARIGELYSGDRARDEKAIEAIFGEHLGKVMKIDATDGVRITFDNGEVIHLRPSGNAPELRCYTEAGTEERAKSINRTAIGIIETWR